MVALKHFIVSLFFVIFLICNLALAQEPFRSFNGDWGVFMGQTDGSKFCYVAAKSNENKDYLVLQYVETGVVRSVLVSEYGFLEDENVFLDLLGNKYHLLKISEFFATRDFYVTGNVIEDMMRANEMLIVKGSGTTLLKEDKFSLFGFKESLSEMIKFCEQEITA
jgi:hypothetical protein